MNAITALPSLDGDAASRQAWFSRTHMLLTRSPAGNRALDRLTAEAIGWQTRTEAGVRFWRRFRPSWERESHHFPPRYSSSVEASLAEFSPQQVLTVTVGPGYCHARLGAHDEAAVMESARSAELALAAILVASRMFHVEPGSAA